VTTEVISRFSDIRKVSEKTLFRFNKLKERVNITCERNSFQVLNGFWDEKILKIVYVRTY
jgi:hypothetical protein